jgi:hypothetical protein
MPAHEVPRHDLTLLLEETFAALIDKGEVDVVVNRDLSEFEVISDEWTLHLEGWPLTTGFLALDDEPATDTERRAALDAALDTRHLAALRQLDRALDGALAAVLTDSGDALSELLVSVLQDDDSSDLLDSLDDAPTPLMP